MIEAREAEWQALQEHARRMLDDPASLPPHVAPRQFLPTLHLWSKPAFTAEKHWVFYRPQAQLNPQPQPLVCAITWEREADYKRLNDPLTGLQQGFHAQPTFDVETTPLDRKQFDGIHARLAALSLPPFVQTGVLGLDGEHRGVETLGLYANARMTWWSVYPETWTPLVRWFESVLASLAENR